MTRQAREGVQGKKGMGTGWRCRGPVVKGEETAGEERRQKDKSKHVLSVAGKLPHLRAQGDKVYREVKGIRHIGFCRK